MKNLERKKKTRTTNSDTKENKSFNIINIKKEKIIIITNKKETSTSHNKKQK